MDYQIVSQITNEYMLPLSEEYLAGKNITIENPYCVNFILRIICDLVTEEYIEHVAQLDNCCEFYQDCYSLAKKWQLQSVMEYIENYIDCQYDKLYDDIRVTNNSLVKNMLNIKMEKMKWIS